MAALKYRTITITLSAVAIIYNTLSAYLFHHLPDDSFHLALSFCAYSHFASLLSILGLIGAIREHAFLVTIFANYLIIDTILCFIPRFLTATLLSGLRDSLCSDPNLGFISQSPTSSASVPVTPYGHGNNWTVSEPSCHRVVAILQAVVFVSAVATTLAHFLLALQVREYGNKLMIQEEDWRIEACNDRKGAAMATMSKEPGDWQPPVYGDEKIADLFNYEGDDEMTEERELSRSRWMACNDFNGVEKLG
ncbi:MAG: hypothetical protein M1819_004538 [Sarea resinae]|nr:MAG: hypothetical protein M1819_004538 [Sarea resinae]